MGCHTYNASSNFCCAALYICLLSYFLAGICTGKVLRLILNRLRFVITATIEFYTIFAATYVVSHGCVKIFRCIRLHRLSEPSFTFSTFSPDASFSH